MSKRHPTLSVSLDVVYSIMSKIGNFDDLIKLRLVSKMFYKAFNLLVVDTNEYSVCAEEDFDCILLPWDNLCNSLKDATILFFEELTQSESNIGKHVLCIKKKYKWIKPQCPKNIIKVVHYNTLLTNNYSKIIDRTSCSYLYYGYKKKKAHFVKKNRVGKFNKLCKATHSHIVGDILLCDSCSNNYLISCYQEDVIKLSIHFGCSVGSILFKVKQYEKCKEHMLKCRFADYSIKKSYNVPIMNNGCSINEI